MSHAEFCVRVTIGAHLSASAKTSQSVQSGRVIRIQTQNGPFMSDMTAEPSMIRKLLDFLQGKTYRFMFIGYRWNKQTKSYFEKKIKLEFGRLPNKQMYVIEDLYGIVRDEKMENRVESTPSSQQNDMRLKIITQSHAELLAGNISTFLGTLLVPYHEAGGRFNSIIHSVPNFNPMPNHVLRNAQIFTEYNAMFPSL